MSADPILVLQMHRMGDLILTMPLLRHLLHHWPGHEVWVAAEPHFFQDLMPLAPQVVFFPSAHCPALGERHYELALNLSSRPQALSCQAQLTAMHKFGPEIVTHGPQSHSNMAGQQHINGFWQLYRAALTHNNHNNAFHWADLYMLDLSAQPDLTGVFRPSPRSAGTNRVGMVLGASELAKRPDVDFWARLARRLAAEGLFPLFLGGPAEQNMGHEVAQKAGLPGANLCGRLSLKELAALMRTLDLCITPDTGPMHLADFVGVPVLNLSMGPVHARETGPSAPGQYVLRAAMSCVGCWQCYRGRLYCKHAFTASGVAGLSLSLLRTPNNPAVPQGLRLYRTGRDALGLYTLKHVGQTADTSCRPLLEDLWQAVFLFLYNPAQHPLLIDRLERLRTAFPRLAESVTAGLAGLCASFSRHLRQGAHVLPDDFWRSQPPVIRLFSGYLHMNMQNDGYSSKAWHAALENLEEITALFMNPS